MEDLTEADRVSLINAIACRDGTAQQISRWFGYTVDELRSFVDENREEIEEARREVQASTKDDGEDDGQVTPTQLEELWIGNKYERLQRYERIADLLYKQAQSDPTDSTVLRELRSYMVAAANELGQLLHRGSGESGSDSLSVDIQGVELDKLK